MSNSTLVFRGMKLVERLDEANPLEHPKKVHANPS